MEAVTEQMIGAGVGLAGLILVFLGVIVTAWDGYDREGKTAVAATYKWRASLAFGGLLLALLGALAGFSRLAFSCGGWVITAGLSCLAGACLAMLGLAGIVLYEIISVSNT